MVLMSFSKSVRKKLSKNGFGFCVTFLEVVKKFIKKLLFAVFAIFLASLQMQFSQSNDYVKWFLMPFLKSMRKNLTNIKTKLKLDHTYIHIYLGYQIVHNK